MIPTPSGWSAHRGARELLLVHPDGLEAGAVVYEERLRPLARLRDLVAVALAARTPYAPARVGRAEIVATAEGEDAALVTVAGTLSGAPVQLDLGFVIFEDSYARLVGTCAAPGRFAEMTATLRELVDRDGHLLGTRPRRTRYVRPAGWHGVARALITEWYPPGFPRQRAVLTVWPALPTGRDPVGWWRAAAQPELGFVVDEARAATPPASDHGLVGRRFQLVRRGDGALRDVVALEDDRYRYLFRLERDAAADAAPLLAALDGVVRTTRPVPRRRAERGDRAVLEHWV